MAVPTRITDISTTAASNSPSGSESVGTSLDDYLRAIQTVYRLDLASKGADIASATTTDLGAVGGLAHDITGTTTITGFGTVDAGIWKVVKFEGALTLTHNATSLILPGGANITTADGDIGIFISEGSGNWRCVSYLSVATQAQMEAGSSTANMVTPGRQHFHQSAAKAWCYANASGSALASYNVNSVTDNGTGSATINWETDFSSANYAAVATLVATGANIHKFQSAAADSLSIDSFVPNTLASADPSSGYMVVAFGDHA
jgi:hypothetical protein